MSSSPNARSAAQQNEAKEVSAPRRSVKPGVSSLARNSYFAAAIYAYLYLFGDSAEPLPSEQRSLLLIPTTNAIPSLNSNSAATLRRVQPWQ